MYLIRKAGGLALIAGLLAGCQDFHVQLDPRSPVGAAALENTPIATDPAMDKRQWDVSEANYANDAVWAHPIYSPLQVDELPYKANAIVENALFLGNVCYIPVGMFIQAPWSFQANKSLALPPSYTLMPPLTEGAQVPSTY
jgi:hypothetical protein